MSKEETRFEKDKRTMLYAIEVVEDKDELTNVILDIADRMLFNKTHPHIEREFHSIYGLLDSLYSKHMELEARVDELEKQLSEKK